MRDMDGWDESDEGENRGIVFLNVGKGSPRVVLYVSRKYMTFEHNIKTWVWQRVWRTSVSGLKAGRKCGDWVGRGVLRLFCMLEAEWQVDLWCMGALKPPLALTGVEEWAIHKRN